MYSPFPDSDQLPEHVLKVYPSFFADVCKTDNSGSAQPLTLLASWFAAGPAQAVLRFDVLAVRPVIVVVVDFSMRWGILVRAGVIR
jgi:hypothetical protein